MKVALDSQIFLFQRFGGVSRYFSRLAENLNRVGAETRIFAPFYDNAYVEQLPPKILKGTRIPGCCRRVSRFAERPNFMLSQAGMKLWKPEIVHETYFQSGGPYIKGTPTVLTIYDMIHEMFPEQFRNNDTTAIKKRDAIRRADHLICISENTRKDLIRLFGVPHEKTSVVHLAFDPPEHPPQTARSPNDDDAVPIILYVGQRGEYKNFAKVLEAYASSDLLRNGTRLVAFGGGAFTPEERSKIDRFGLGEDQVEQTEGDDKALLDAYRRARVFVYPSTYEGFGLPPLEAIAAGCIVASSNTSSMPEVLGEAAQYFDPHSLPEIVSALEKTAFDEIRRVSLRKLGTERLNLFSWEKCARETLSVYETLV